MTANRRLWIEYTGSWPNQCYQFDGRAVVFWTLSDGRQVADAGSEPAYRYLLENEEAVEPFVPKGDTDWVEVKELASVADKLKAQAQQSDVIARMEGRLRDLEAKALADMKLADDLELKAQRLRSETSALEDEFAAKRKEIEAAKNTLAEMRGEKPSHPAAPEPEDKPEPKPKKPKAKPKGKKQ